MVWKGTGRYCSFTCSQRVGQGPQHTVPSPSCCPHSGRGWRPPPQLPRRGKRVLRIRDILIRIRILTSGYWIRIRIRIRIRPQILVFSSVTFKMTISKKNFQIFCLFLFEATFTSFFKDKKSKRSHKTVGNQCFSYYFCLMMEGSVPLTNGSGSGRPKNIWILRIRIRNTGGNNCHTYSPTRIPIHLLSLTSPAKSQLIFP